MPGLIAKSYQSPRRFAFNLRDRTLKKVDETGRLKSPGKNWNIM